MYFDRSETEFANFHIAFLAGLSSYLGFEPTPVSSSEPVFFDIRNGSFTAMPPVHGSYAKPEISSILANFFISSYDSAGKIALNGVQRNEVLETILKYYSFHLPGLKKINSLEVLKQVFL